MAITPQQLAAAGTESAHQQALFCHTRSQWDRYPELKWFHSIPNGGDRGSSFSGAKMKAEGVRPGVSDMLLPVARQTTCKVSGVITRYSGLYIELKKLGLEGRKNGGMSDLQVEFSEFVKRQGFAFSLCYGWEQSWIHLQSYLDLQSPFG